MTERWEDKLNDWLIERSNRMLYGPTDEEKAKEVAKKLEKKRKELLKTKYTCNYYVGDRNQDPSLRQYSDNIHVVFEPVIVKEQESRYLDSGDAMLLRGYDDSRVIKSENAELKEAGYFVEREKRERVNLKDLGVEGPWQPSVGGAIVGGAVFGPVGIIAGAILGGGNVNELEKVTKVQVEKKFPLLVIRMEGRYPRTYSLTPDAFRDCSWEYVAEIKANIDVANSLGVRAILKTGY